MEIKPQKKFVEENEIKKKENLYNLYGNNKKFARGFELPALIALSFYPELKNVEIEFVFTKSNTPFSSKPTPSTVLLPGKKRKYQINVCKEIRKERVNILPRNLSFNILIGLIGHELAHISDYINKNSLQVIGTGLFYPIKTYKRNLEKSIDLSTVHHGLGYQLWEYSNLIKKLKKEFPNDRYYKTYYDYYLSPESIELEISNSKIYNSSK
jgi:hypothetical protein